MGLHYLNAFDNQTFNITFLVEVFNGYSKIFNTVMLFLRQITKDSVKKKSFMFLAGTFHLKVSFAVSMTGSLKYSQSSFM